MDSELLASFCSITGSTAPTAEYYLTAANGDLEMAIGLFYEAGGREAGDKEREMQAAPVVVNRNADGGEDVDEEAGLADASSRNGGSAGGRVNSATATSRAAVMQASAAATATATATTSAPTTATNIFNPPRMTAPVVHVINESEASEDDVEILRASQPRSRAQRLADLFRPPHEIMFPGTFEAARRRAREQCRWLLVTFHVSTEFCCQAMNRDCWNDPQLQEFIRENLVFLQLNEGSPDASRYASFYPFDRLHPHTAIIDPRTGERVKTLLVATIPVPGFRVISGGAREMLEELVGFTAEQEPIGVVELVGPPESIGSNGPSFSEACAISDISGNSTSNVNTVDVGNTAQTDQTTEGDERPTSPTAGKKAKLSATTTDAAAAFIMPEEPPADSPSTLIQFRLPDGSRLRRRFLLDAPVEEVLAVAEAACQRGRDGFELRSAEGTVRLEEGRRIGEVAGLRNCVITVVLDEN